MIYLKISEAFSTTESDTKMMLIISICCILFHLLVSFTGLATNGAKITGVCTPSGCGNLTQYFIRSDTIGIDWIHAELGDLKTLCKKLLQQWVSSASWIAHCLAAAKQSFWR
jgi:hypothetical protein